MSENFPQTNTNRKDVGKMDQRIENTKKDIRRALIRLSAAKPYPEITVKELCAAAGVNRSTFYAHYKNTREVLEDIEKRALGNYDWRRALERENRQNVLAFLKKHKEVFSLLLDYGSIKKHLLNNSIANNRKTLEAFGYDFSDDDLTIATILTVSSLLEAFRYMATSGKTYDMDKILEYMIAISNQRYKELADQAE